MGPLQATVRPCLWHNSTVLIVDVLDIFLPTVAVNQGCLYTIAEGLKYKLVLLSVVTQRPSLRNGCSAHGQGQLHIHRLKRLFGQQF